MKKQNLGIRLSDLHKHKLRIISQKTGLNFTEFIEKLIELEYEKIKGQGWERVYTQMDLFADQPIDQFASLFDDDDDLRGSA